MKFSSTTGLVTPAAPSGRVVDDGEIEVAGVHGVGVAVTPKNCGQLDGSSAWSVRQVKPFASFRVTKPMETRGTMPGVTGLAGQRERNGLGERAVGDDGPEADGDGRGRGWVCSGLRAGSGGRKMDGAGTVPRETGRESEALVGEHDVAEDDADIGERLRLAGCVEKAGGEADGEGQGVVAGPLNFGDWRRRLRGGDDGIAVRLSKRGSTSGWPWLFCVATWVRRTAQRWRMSASAGLPVCGPRTSWKMRTSPGWRLGKLPSSVASVAPAGRQQLVSPQV